MQQSLKHKHKEEYNVTVRYDQTPINPREWDNTGIMVCSHRRYNLGDEQINADDYKDWSDVLNSLDYYVALPLYLYDHSGLTISTTRFNCRWDSGQIGYIYTTKEHLKKMGHKTIPPKDKVKQWLKGEVEEYDKYLRGDVYTFIVEKITYCSLCDHPHKEVIDSCSGFYDLEHLKDHLGEYVKYWDGEVKE